MKCIHCQGKMKRSFSPFHINRKGCHLMLDNVPAWVCVQCGEAYFEEKEVDTVQDLIKLIDQKTEELAMMA
ncbi:MAG: type II toxin-antitoxin system MqsA family antitoxin [Deltaproteobacteria bacterium]|nr:type II toxin-antitoxin system MqsA family antitoxin [Deltaproteobacteria bacterium]MBW2614509.1 type II toxin-antitoxin system MqsA family antitoxin [Deltaproteobacteria bacterium]MBW2633903.1 type II toxin-antitoxin system MqsA family antitoxin [Deltaproteobacteria bacterium]MBW2678635.1 type II toxin-antitoxin system MqsA family antitoxin [Deltaproteobacteria bacterium]